jgi:hypothetical protein
MNRTYLRKIIVVACGIVVSAPLTVVIAGWTGFGGPGAYVDYYLFPPWRVDHRVVGKVLAVYFGTTFVLVFSVLVGLYLLLTKLLRGRP